jgi:hypothetical protein
MLKRIFLALLAVLTIISISLCWLSINPLSISNDFIQGITKRYAKDITVETENVQLKFINYKFQVDSSSIKLTTKTKNTATLKNIILSINPWKLNGSFYANLFQSELLSLVPLDGQPEMEKSFTNFANNNSLLFNGTIEAKFNLIGLSILDVNLTGLEDSRTSKKISSNGLRLKKCELSISHKNDQLLINKFNLLYNKNITTSLFGKILFSGKDFVSADITTNLNNLPIPYLKDLWPSFVMPNIYTWVTTHILEGMIKNISGKIKITKKDLDAPNLPKESVNIKITANNVKLIYLDGYSPIRNIDSITTINGESLHVKALKASMKGNSISDAEVKLPFKTLLLSLKANVSGHIRDFIEFVPETVQKKLISAKIPFQDIQGYLNGIINLSLPLSEDFKIENLALNVKSSVDDFILDKFKAIRLKHGTLGIINDKEKITVKVGEGTVTSFSLIQYHDPLKKNRNQIKFDSLLKIIKPLKLLDKLKLKSGITKFKLSMTEDSWNLYTNFDKNELVLIPLGYTKEKNTALSSQCSGKFNKTGITSDSCSITGDKFGGDIIFSYSYLDKNISSFIFKNAIIGPNKFTSETTFGKDIVTAKITSKYLDLSNADFTSSNKKKNLDYKIDFNIDQLFLKSKIALSDAKGHIGKIGRVPPEISIHALTDGEQITFSQAKKNGEDMYSLYSASASALTKAFGIYDNIKKGKIWLDIFPKIYKENIKYDGKISIKDFSFTGTSTLTKLILGVMSPFNSPIAVAEALKGGSLKADSFTADIEYQNGLLKISNGLISGPSYEVRIEGYANMNEKILAFKGLYIPSFYGINTLISVIPLLGNILSGGKDSAFIAANFSISGDFDSPETFMNPLSILTPGFLRNIFN